MSFSISSKLECASSVPVGLMTHLPEIGFLLIVDIIIKGSRVQGFKGSKVQRSKSEKVKE